jgi:hypothetical protein
VEQARFARRTAGRFDPQTPDALLRELVTALLRV